MNKDQIKELALAVYRKEVPTETNFSFSDMEGSLREQFRALAPNYDAYRRNKLDIFEIIQSVVDVIAPNRIRDAIGRFADVQTLPQGAKARFRLKKGRNNVRRFITKVGLGGVFERVRLDSDFVDVPTYAIGGAGYIELEQFLDGTMDFVELTDLIIAGIEDEIYKSIQNALINTFSSLPAANKWTAASFSAPDMKKVINTVRAYGGNATIICTPAFAATITPDPSFAAEADKIDLREQGYIGRYFGANVVILPQSFVDETNASKVFSDQYAVVVPTGGAADEKIVKVVLEGQSVVEEVKNADQSMEFQVYKKVGTAVLNVNFYGLYQNTAL
jgi:hypothetical protein